MTASTVQPATQALRDIAVAGHASSGKSTLLDRFLQTADAPHAGGKVCDFDAEELVHGHSIEPSVVHLRRGARQLNLIDTPGYADFAGGLLASMAAVDAALICVNAHATDIEIGTRRAMDAAAEAGIGRMIMVTKLDDPNADFKSTLSNLRDLYGPAVVPVLVPLGQGEKLRGVADVIELPGEARDAVMNLAHAHETLVERVVETDSKLMEAYFEGTMPEPSALRELMSHAIATGEVIPVMCVSVETNVGVEESLDMIAKLSPAPSEVARRGIDPAADELVAQVFKVRIDPFVQKLSFIRVFSGSLRKDDMVHVSGERKDVKMNPILRVQGEHTEPIDVAVAGDIVAVAKMDDLHVGTVIGHTDLPPITLPEPMVGMAFTPMRHGDENKLATAMHKLTEEDPTLHLSRDGQTGEMVMTGLSELHLQILQERLLRRDKIEIETHDPRIPYRETITQAASGVYRHKKQSGGRGQFAEVHLRMMPLPRGTDVEEFANKDRFPSLRSYRYHRDENFLFVDSIVGGAIPGNFMPAIEKGFLERIGRGVIAGYPLRNLAIEVHDGKHHPVDSSEAAFKIAGAMGLRQVAKECRPTLLEPIVSMHIDVPQDCVGDVYGDMSSRGGRVMGSDSIGGDLQRVDCEVPLRVVGHYNRTLSSMTGGRGSFTLSLSHYETVPGDVAVGLMKEEAEEAAT